MGFLTTFCKLSPYGWDGIYNECALTFDNWNFQLAVAVGAAAAAVVAATYCCPHYVCHSRLEKMI